MSAYNDGGPAFPAQPIQHFPDGSAIVQEQGGMTLRDYFAAKAMQAAVSTGDMPSDWLGFHEAGDWVGLAKYAYQIADAMLAARGAA